MEFSNAANVGGASYTYDANHNKLSEAWTGAMAAWNFVTTNTGTYPQGYDHEDRFVHFAQAGQSKTFNFTRSDIGNINNINLNGTGTARGFNNIHALTSIGSTTQVFNPDGNLTTSHAGHTNTWDEAGMMKQSVVSTGSAFGIAGTNEYGYDANRKRVWKKITRNGSVAEHSVFVHAGPNLIAQYPAGTAAASPTQEYVYAASANGGPEIDSLVMLVRNNGNEKLTITRNQQWSVSALSDSANGTVLERYTYDHFGKRTILEPNGTTIRTTSSYNMPFGYTSREHDAETGLMYFRARYYDPHTAEFTSPDPLEYVDGMSLFRGYFVLAFKDPLGMFRDWTKPQDVLGGTLVAVDKEGNGIFQPSAGFCYIIGPEGEPKRIACPGEGGFTDHNDPTILDGGQGIRDGLKNLEDACSCCDGPCKQCSIDECKNEAKILIAALLLAWTSNYGKGTCRDEDAVAGSLCWDWALIFEGSLKNQSPKCFNIELDWAQTHQPIRPDFWGYHAYVRVSACANQNSTDCLVTFDDGYFEDGFSHPGQWPTRPDYGDQDGWIPENPLLPTDGILVPPIPR